MQLGIDTFVERVVTAGDEFARNSAERVRQMLAEAELADRVGLDVYAIGEHHREEYVASSPATLLAAVAARTENIRLASAVTVLSSDDPVRVFQQFATVDLISNGRAEIIVGRGSFIESYPLFGYDTRFYDELFAEKLDLLMRLRDEVRVHWEGRHRGALTGQGVWPRPVQNPLPIRLGVGGTPASFVRAGTLGLPLTVAVIGGEPHRFRPLVDLYRRSWAAAGHDPGGADVALHCIGYVAETDEQAGDELWPAYQHTFTRIGRERGWGPTSRVAFEAQRGPAGAFLVGSPETVAAKIRTFSEALGGISRVTLMLSGGLLAHDRLMRSIELMGTQVKPRL
jgi:probable LLM family oxidoreductase